MAQNQNNLVQMLSTFVQATGASLQATPQSHQEPIETVAMRKLQEKDPEFEKFDGKLEHFLEWLTRIEERRRHRNVPDAVAIRYALMALGDV